MRLSFDIAQLGNALLWQAPNVDGERNLYAASGRHAGALHLRYGDALLVELTGYGADDQLVSTHVLDAVLVTLPHASGGGFVPPSPCSSVRAAVPIERWSAAEIHHDRDRQLKASVQRSLSPLEVIQQDGRWRMALTLTVLVARHTAEGLLNEVRVFSFDPDVHVAMEAQNAGGFGERPLMRSG